ncbi:MAG: hypothetical protein AAF633_16780 [Chloroflexota bacterium]
MNSQYITFDYHSGQIRRDLVRETDSQPVKIYQKEVETSAAAKFDLFSTIARFGKSFFAPQFSTVSLQVK